MHLKIVVCGYQKEISYFFRKSVADTAISSLQELRNNTWDKDRVDALIEFLETGKKTYNIKSVEFEIKVQDD